MNKELQKNLYTKFPNVFSRHEDLNKDNESYYRLDISIGDGWYKILYNLAEKLEPLSNNNTFWFAQIKEKFGSARFYIRRDPDSEFDFTEVNKYISDAEDETYHICEYCGELGKIRSLAWVKTLCDKCFKDHKKPRRIP
jgi:hypothetical protein